MNTSQLNKSRLIVGIILIIVAVLMFLFLDGDYAAAAIGIVGLVSIAISRRK